MALWNPPFRYGANSARNRIAEALAGSPSVPAADTARGNGARMSRWGAGTHRITDRHESVRPAAEWCRGGEYDLILMWLVMAC